MTRHIYTEALAPLNTGSIERPARFNLRLTCQARARTHKALGALRANAAMTGAETWERIALPMLECLVRDMRREGLDPADYLKRMREAEGRA